VQMAILNTWCYRPVRRRFLGIGKFRFLDTPIGFVTSALVSLNCCRVIGSRTFLAFQTPTPVSTTAGEMPLRPGSLDNRLPTDRGTAVGLSVGQGIGNLVRRPDPAEPSRRGNQAAVPEVMGVVHMACLGIDRGFRRVAGRVARSRVVRKPVGLPEDGHIAVDPASCRSFHSGADLCPPRSGQDSAARRRGPG